MNQDQLIDYTIKFGLINDNREALTLDSWNIIINAKPVMLLGIPPDMIPLLNIDEKAYLDFASNRNFHHRNEKLIIPNCFDNYVFYMNLLDINLDYYDVSPDHIKRHPCIILQRYILKTMGYHRFDMDENDKLILLNSNICDDAFIELFAELNNYKLRVEIVNNRKIKYALPLVEYIPPRYIEHLNEYLIIHRSICMKLLKRLDSEEVFVKLESIWKKIDCILLNDKEFYIECIDKKLLNYKHFANHCMSIDQDILGKSINTLIDINTVQEGTSLNKPITRNYLIDISYRLNYVENIESLLVHILHHIDSECIFYTSLSKKVQNTKCVYIKQFQLNINSYNLLDETLKNNKDVVLELLEINRKLYSILPEKFQHDKDVYTFVFTKSPKSIRHVSGITTDMYLTALNGHDLGNHHYVVKLYPRLPDEIKNNPKVIESLISDHGFIYKYLSNDNKMNLDYIKKAVGSYPDNIKNTNFPWDLLATQTKEYLTELMLLVVNSKSLLYKFIPDKPFIYSEIKNNPVVIKAGLYNNHAMMQYLDNETKCRLSTLKWATKYFDREFVSMKHFPEFIKIIMRDDNIRVSEIHNYIKQMELRQKTKRIKSARFVSTN